MNWFSDEDSRSTERLRRAYLKLALEHHPDKQALESQQAATMIFQEIQAAYEELDARLRRAEGRPVSQGAGVQAARIRTALSAACELGDLDAVKRLLAHRPDDVNKTDDLGATPLMFAARAGSVEVCRTLLEAGADLHARSAIRWTALFWAALRDRREVCEMLILEGAEVSNLLLSLVAWTGNPNSLAVLLRSVDVQRVFSLRERKGQTLPHLAVGGLAHEKSPDEAHLSCLRQLIELKCDPLAVDGHGRTVLEHYISERQYARPKEESPPSEVFNAISELCSVKALAMTSFNFGSEARDNRDVDVPDTHDGHHAHDSGEEDCADAPAKSNGSSFGTTFQHGQGYHDSGSSSSTMRMREGDGADRVHGGPNDWSRWTSPDSAAFEAGAVLVQSVREFFISIGKTCSQSFDCFKLVPCICCARTSRISEPK